ncbi:hypothetical protein [Paracoccus onubensis]|uniref:hypothetical protein n=1 Tax=Paracoccus onubensis TaxID=1675788 RepID=UPI0011C38565|nr:hypothetical protein [Paracoccus onubensis]
MPNKKITSDLLQGLTHNAIASLRMGVEDYQSNDADRQLSAARNFAAGTLLLGKACLVNAAPPNSDPMAVLGAKFSPVIEGNEFVIKPASAATIDVEQLKKRFRDFGLPAPRGDLDRLTKLRNAIEHLHTDQGPQQVKEAIAACFPTVLGFFELLGRSPLEDLGAAWETMQAVESFQKEEAARCAKTFEAVDWPNSLPIRPECPECGSALVAQKNPANSDPVMIKLRCLSCGSEKDDYQAIAVLVEGAFGGEAFRAARDGANGPIYDCPECGHSLYIANSEVNTCLYCGYEVDGACSVCGERLGVGNVDWEDHSLCSYHAYVASKERYR